jgi:methylmalonyl-CoA mutase N-terminal domain/subunit
MLRAIETGYVQREIEHAAYEYQRDIESGEQVVVGVNRFTNKEETSIPLLRINEELERQQVERLNAVRARRDASVTREALAGVEQAARGEENLMPHIIGAVEASATLGEISDRLRAVFGEYTGAAD